jgi:hypothetical protein
MKKVFIILISLIFLFGVFFSIFWNQKSKTPKAGVRFVGFTNNPYGQPELRFSFTNYSQRASYEIVKINEQTGSGWQNIKPPSHFIIYKNNQFFSEMGFPIVTTNKTLRLIFRVNEKSNGLQGFIDSTKEFFSKLTGTSEDLYLGRIYFITNEINTH